MPPTPPPDIDLDLARSLDTIEAWAPPRLAITHFGTFDDPEAQIAELREALDRARRGSRDTDAVGFERAVRAWISRSAPRRRGVLPGHATRRAVPRAYRYWATRAESARRPGRFRGPTRDPCVSMSQAVEVELREYKDPDQASAERGTSSVRNDDHNTFDQCCRCAFADDSRQLAGIVGFSSADRIHNTGLAIVWSGHRELAELYWEQLRDWA